MEDTDPMRWSPDERIRLVTRSELFYALKAFEHRTAMERLDQERRRCDRGMWIFIALVWLAAYTGLIVAIVRDTREVVRGASVLRDRTLVRYDDHSSPPTPRVAIAISGGENAS